MNFSTHQHPQKQFPTFNRINMIMKPIIKGLGIKPKSGRKIQSIPSSSTSNINIKDSIYAIKNRVILDLGCGDALIHDELHSICSVRSFDLFSKK